MTGTRFLWSDAWLLATIFWAHRAEGRVRLFEIIAYGDALNHAVFNPEEIESGLARLTSAGLVTEFGGSFSPAGQAEAWYREFEKLPLRTVQSMDWVAKKLNAEPPNFTGRDARNNLRYPGFTKDRYEDAVAAYE